MFIISAPGLIKTNIYFRIVNSKISTVHTINLLYVFFVQTVQNWPFEYNDVQKKKLKVECANEHKIHF